MPALGDEGRFAAVKTRLAELALLQEVVGSTASLMLHKLLTEVCSSIGFAPTLLLPNGKIALSPSGDTVQATESDDDGDSATDPMLATLCAQSILNYFAGFTQISASNFTVPGSNACFFLLAERAFFLRTPKGGELAGNLLPGLQSDPLGVVPFSELTVQQFVEGFSRHFLPVHLPAGGLVIATLRSQSLRLNAHEVRAMAKDVGSVLSVNTIVTNKATVGRIFGFQEAFMARLLPTPASNALLVRSVCKNPQALLYGDLAELKSILAPFSGVEQCLEQHGRVVRHLDAVVRGFGVVPATVAWVVNLELCWEKFFRADDVLSAMLTRHHGAPAAAAPAVLVAAVPAHGTQGVAGAGAA